MAQLIVRDLYTGLPRKRPGEQRLSLQPQRASYRAPHPPLVVNEPEADKRRAEVACGQGFLVVSYNEADLEEEEWHGAEHRAGAC